MDLNDLCGKGLGSLEELEELKTYFALTQYRLKTGIEFFDYVTNGGLILGMTVLGGMPNAGKTTLLSQISVELCKRGTPVVYISNDMPSQVVKLKALSYVSNFPFLSESYSTLDLTEGYANGKNIADDVILEMLQLCNKIHIIDISDKKWKNTNGVNLLETSVLGRIMEAYSNRYKESPVFIIDSLQSIAVSADRNTKESVDLNLREVRDLQRKYDVRVILVSNFNRNAYNKPADYFAYKESGSIEYFCDCLLTLDFIDSPKKACKNTFRRLNLVNLKDRASESKSVAINFDVLKSTFYAASSDGDTPVIPVIPVVPDAPDLKAQKSPDAVYDMAAMFGVVENKTENKKFSSFEDFLKC